MDVKSYLDELAEALASSPLPTAAGAAALAEWQQRHRDQVMSEWALEQRMHERGLPPHAVTTGQLEREDYRVERLWFEATPGLIITANLYVPTHLDAPAPGIVYLCGHHPQQKVWYQDHARRFAQLGMVTLTVDTIRNDEILGFHHGTHHMGEFNWFSRGYSPAAVEGWAAVRAFDLLAARDDVDAARIGVTGHSGGGAVSWYAAALEPRFAAVVTSSGTGGEDSHVGDRTLDGHCDCYFPANPVGRPIAELYALVAPRPTLILAPRHDSVYTAGSVERTHERLLSWYRRSTGTDWPLGLLVFDADHRYTPHSRRAAFTWMLEHLAGQTSPCPDDVDGHREQEKDLRVFGVGAPVPENANASVQSWWVPTRAAATNDRHQLAEQVVSTCLRSAQLDGAVDLRVRRHYQREGVDRVDFTFESEPGVRLRGSWLRPIDAERHPEEIVEVVLRPRDVEGRWLPRPLDPGRAGSQVVLDLRGTGQTAWHPGSDWHLRRAAGVLGRTVGSMRLLDALRGLAATREITGAHRLTIVGDAELSVTALVAAVIDPGVVGLDVTGLPETLDRADGDDSTPPAWEIGHLLQVADIADLLSVAPAASSSGATTANPLPATA